LKSLLCFLFLFWFSVKSFPNQIKRSFNSRNNNLRYNHLVLYRVFTITFLYCVFRNLDLTFKKKWVDYFWVNFDHFTWCKVYLRFGDCSKLIIAGSFLTTLWKACLNHFLALSADCDGVQFKLVFFTSISVRMW